MSFLREAYSFLKVRKKFWLAPLFIVILLLGGLLVLTKGSATLPISLMSQDPTPKMAEKPNVCTEQRETAIALARPFTREIGHAYTIKLSGTDAGDTNEAPKQSRLQVCEDEHPLGPAHALHEDIRTKGQGRYSHWGEYLYLSTSDNSDPNTNGRTYSVVAE